MASSSQRALEYSAAFNLDGLGGIGRQVQSILESQTSPEIEIRARDGITPVIKQALGKAKLSPVVVLTAKDLASKSIHNVLKNIAKINSETAEATISANTIDAERKLETVKRKMGEVSDTELDIADDESLSRLDLAFEKLKNIAFTVKNMGSIAVDKIRGGAEEDFYKKQADADKWGGRVRKGLALAGVGAMGAYTVGYAMQRESFGAQFNATIDSINQKRAAAASGPRVAAGGVTMEQQNQIDKIGKDVTATNLTIESTELELKNLDEAMKNAQKSIMGVTDKETLRAARLDMIGMEQQRVGLQEQLLSSKNMNATYMAKQGDIATEKPQVDKEKMNEWVNEMFMLFPSASKQQIQKFGGQFMAAGMSEVEVDKAMRDTMELAAKFPQMGFDMAAMAMQDAFQGEMMRMQEFSLPNSVREAYIELATGSRFAGVWQGERGKELEAAGITKENLGDVIDPQGFINDQKKWRTLWMSMVEEQYGGATAEYGKSTQGQWDQFRSLIKELGADIGTLVLPGLLRVLKVMNTLVQAFMKLPGHEVIGAFIGGLVLMGGTLIGVSKSIIMFGYALKVLDGILKNKSLLSNLPGQAGVVGGAVADKMPKGAGWRDVFKQSYRAGRYGMENFGQYTAPVLEKSSAAAGFVGRGWTERLLGLAGRGARKLDDLDALPGRKSGPGVFGRAAERVKDAGGSVADRVRRTGGLRSESGGAAVAMLSGLWGQRKGLVDIGSKEAGKAAVGFAEDVKSAGRKIVQTGQEQIDASKKKITSDKNVLSGQESVAKQLKAWGKDPVWNALMKGQPTAQDRYNATTPEGKARTLANAIPIPMGAGYPDIERTRTPAPTVLPSWTQRNLPTASRVAGGLKGKLPWGTGGFGSQMIGGAVGGVAGGFLGDKLGIDPFWSSTIAGIGGTIAGSKIPFGWLARQGLMGGAKGMARGAGYGVRGAGAGIGALGNATGIAGGGVAGGAAAGGIAVGGAAAILSWMEMLAGKKGLIRGGTGENFISRTLGRPGSLPDKLAGFITGVDDEIETSDKKAKQQRIDMVKRQVSKYEEQLKADTLSHEEKMNIEEKLKNIKQLQAEQESKKLDDVDVSDMTSTTDEVGHKELLQTALNWGLVTPDQTKSNPFTTEELRTLVATEMNARSKISAEMAARMGYTPEEAKAKGFRIDVEVKSTKDGLDTTADMYQD